MGDSSFPILVVVGSLGRALLAVLLSASSSRRRRSSRSTRPSTGRPCFALRVSQVWARFSWFLGQPSLRLQNEF